MRHAAKETVKELRQSGLAVVVVMDASATAADEGTAREREGIDHGPLANVAFMVRPRRLKCAQGRACARSAALPMRKTHKSGFHFSKHIRSTSNRSCSPLPGLERGWGPILGCLRHTRLRAGAPPLAPALPVRSCGALTLQLPRWAPRRLASWREARTRCTSRAWRAAGRTPRCWRTGAATRTASLRCSRQPDLLGYGVTRLAMIETLTLGDAQADAEVWDGGACRMMLGCKTALDMHLVGALYKADEASRTAARSSASGARRVASRRPARRCRARTRASWIAPRRHS